MYLDQLCAETNEKEFLVENTVRAGRGGGGGGGGELKGREGGREG